MVTVAVAGTDRTCDVVAGSLTLGLGRQNVREKGQPGYCAMRLRVDDELPFVAAFDTVQVHTVEGPRFSGTVAEASLYHLADGSAWQAVNAVGPLANWGKVYIGEPVWPKETIAARAQRIAADINTPIVVLGGDTAAVDRQDVDNRQAKELLEELADSTGGFLFDYPTADGTGTIYLEALGARSVDVQAVTWDMEPAAEAWDALDPALLWADEDTNPFLPIDLSGCWVRADPGPVWVSASEIANEVHITWGDPEQTSTYTDSGSIVQYGIHDTRLDTPLDDAGDVAQLGAVILARAAQPTMHFPTIDLDTSRLPDSLAYQIAGMVPGTRITIRDLPQPAPQEAFLGVVEGWEETWFGQGDAFMRLHVSDVRLSMAVPVWDALDPGWLWDQEPAGATWESELQ